MTVPVSTVKASGGTRRGQNSGKARGHLRTPQESQESGNTAGSIGRLPFLTHTSGRQPCCQSVPPRPELTFGHTQVSSTLALPWLSLQQLQRMLFPRTCSVCCFWRGSNFRSQSTRRCALVATLLWTLWGATEPHAAAQADSRSGRRVRREGGARVRYNAFLRKMNVGARAADERRAADVDGAVLGRARWIKRPRTPNC